MTKQQPAGVPESGTEKKHRKKLLLTTAIILTAAGAVGGVGFWKHQNRFEVKEEKVVVELGDTFSTDPKEYIDASDRILKETTIDFSHVDRMNVGIYEVEAVAGERKAAFQIEVQDTVKPEVIFKEGTYQTIVGKDYAASNIIEAVEDQGGIQSVTFQENQVEIASEDTAIWAKLGIRYEEAGTKENVLIVTDKNGNVTEQTVTIEVVEDYAAHVQGIHDLTVEKDASVDWMSGITKDEKIKAVSADASRVAMHTIGEYDLTYVITGDDGKTVVEKVVKVAVVEPEKVQDTANTGGKTSNGGKTSGGTKPKSPSKPSGNKGTSGSQSASGSGSNSWLDSLKPGQSWNGHQTGSGFIGGGDESTGSSTWESWEADEEQ